MVASSRSLGRYDPAARTAVAPDRGVGDRLGAVDGDVIPRRRGIRLSVGPRVPDTRPQSLQIEASVTDWERWTEMSFPEDGEYVFPSGLAPLRVRDGTGAYWEPNVWMLHDF